MSAADSLKISLPFQRAPFSSAAFQYHTDVCAEDGLALARAFRSSGREQSKALLIIGSYSKTDAAHPCLVCCSSSLCMAAPQGWAGVCQSPASGQPLPLEGPGGGGLEEMGLGDLSGGDS